MIGRWSALPACLVAGGCFGMTHQDDDHEPVDDPTGGSVVEQPLPGLEDDPAPDSGRSSGTTAGSGLDTGAERRETVPAGLPITDGRHYHWHIVDSGLVGSWSLMGTTVDCGACPLSFEVDFTPLGGSDPMVRTLTFRSRGDGEYVYTNQGEYWGFGFRNGFGYASWSNDGAVYGYFGQINY